MNSYFAWAALIASSKYRMPTESLMNKTKAIRYHDISYGHRVVGHENNCAHLHGHNGRFYFHCEAYKLDSVGRVIDFGIIKKRLCMWLEDTWDHKFLVWEKDPMYNILFEADPLGVVKIPFNPTAENMARYLVESVGPNALANTGVVLTKVVIHETAKCSASYEKL